MVRRSRPACPPFHPRGPPFHPFWSAVPPVLVRRSTRSGPPFHPFWSAVPPLCRAGIPGFAHGGAEKKPIFFALTREKHKKHQKAQKHPQKTTKTTKNTKKTPKNKIRASARKKTSRVKKKPISNPGQNAMKPKKNPALPLWSAVPPVLVRRCLELLESAGFWVDSGLSLPARAGYDARTDVMR